MHLILSFSDYEKNCSIFILPPSKCKFLCLCAGHVSGQVNDNIVWIDVRSQREYRRVHIEGAINIPHGDIGHKIFVEVPDTFKEVHIYDGSQGTFAGIALEILMEIGFQEVVNEGGYDALLEKQGLNEK